MSNTQYWTKLTAAGREKVLAAIANKQSIHLSEFAVGQGSISEHDTDLRQPVYRSDVNYLKQLPEQPLVEVVGVVPASEGGFYVREAAFYTDDGKAFAIIKYPETYKPASADNAAAELGIKAVIDVIDGQVLSEKIDPSMIYATKEWVSEQIFTRAIMPLEARTHSKNIAVNLSSQVQTKPFRRSVIALCELKVTKWGWDSWTHCRLSFHRVNNIISPVIADVAVGYVYNSDRMRGFIKTIGHKNAAKLCTFMYNGKKYGGVEFHFSAPEHNYVTCNGVGTFTPFGLDYFDIKDNIALNSEVADSLDFDSSIIFENAMALNGSNILTDKRLCEDDDVLTGESADLVVTPKAAAAGDNKVRQEMVMHGLGNRVSHQSDYFMTRSFDLVMNNNTPREFPDLPPDASDILVFCTTQNTLTQTNLVARFHKEDGEWNSSVIYSYGIASNRPNVSVINGKPHFTTAHSSDYVYSLYCQIATQKSGRAKPFDFYENAYTTYNKPAPTEIGALAENTDITITKNNPWLTLDSPNTGSYINEQVAGISLGESGRVYGGASLHLSYIGNGYSYIGMGSMGEDNIPDNWTMQMHYQNSWVRFRSSIHIQDSETKIGKGTSNSLRLQTNYGFVDIGAQNYSYCHYKTDRSAHWFNKNILVSGEIYAGPSNDQRVYHTSNKPTPSEIGALAENTDITITKNNPWLTLDSTNVGSDNSEQAAGISLGESARIYGDASLHLSYIGNGYSYIGMGNLGEDNIPDNWAMKMHYQRTWVQFRSSIYLQNSRTQLAKGSNDSVKIQTNSGALHIGSQNPDFCHYDTDRPSHWFNASIKVRGELYAGANYNQRVYHTGNKPSAAEVTGGTFAGDVFATLGRSWNCKLADTPNAIGVRVWSNTGAQLVGGLGVYSPNGNGAGSYAYMGTGEYPYNSGIKVSDSGFSYKNQTVYHSGNISQHSEKRTVISNGVLDANGKHYITASNTFYLPSVTNLTQGTAVVVSKAMAAQPTIRVHGEASETIKMIKKGQMIENDSVQFDTHCTLTFILNSEKQWELQYV